ncbi:ComEC/Rec2 family competence protein [Kitasatospora sp. McL0602]|uniref:ComEC/Rec2 family competence protein n=1 Tax=Kitasatospora sp. McL0602 TaxID=3439530 RepID=UPI003F8CE7A5
MNSDLRLIAPAISAWAVTAATLGVGPAHRPWLLLAAGAALAGALLLLTVTAVMAVTGGHRRTAAVVAAVLLTGAAATVTTLLHTADLHRGPLPYLARQPEPTELTEPTGPTGPTELTVEATVDGDPRAHRSRSQGTTPAQPLLTVRATVDRVSLPTAADPVAGTGPAPVHTRTPVTLMIRSQDAADWRPLLPSTRLRADVRVLPEAGRAPGAAAESSAVVLLVRGPPRVLAPPDLPQRLAGRLRAGLRRACDHLPPDTRGLLPGLVVGDTSRLPDDLAESFRATDLGHLTAVSGANLAIVLTVLIGAPSRADSPGRSGLAGALGLSLRATALLGTALTLAFVTVCRPDPSVLRAAATALIGLLALATGRPRQALSALSGAVLVLVLLDPWLARSFGFVLSTLATAGLLTLGPRWTSALLGRRWPRPLAAAVASTAAAQALCAPVTVLLAPRVSLVAVPCNVLAELAVAPATLLGFAALVADPVSSAAARFLADLAALPTGWLAAVARRGAALPGAQLDLPAGLLGASTLAVATLAVAWAVRPFGSRSPRRGRTGQPRHRRLALVAVLGAALLAVLLRPPLLTRIATGWPPDGWRLVMCDVGQGDMTVLPLPAPSGESTDSAVVVDAGPDPRAADECLRALGVTRVPLLILSHFHADHAEGLPGVLRGRSVGALQVTTSDSPVGERARVLGWAAAAHLPVVRAQRGERRTAGPGLSWEVLWPDGQSNPAAPGANNSSVALLVSVGLPPEAFRFALLGDLEPPAQSALRARPPPAVDVLKVAHHGSANQDWQLTAALAPRLALISCGRDNPYGRNFQFWRACRGGISAGQRAKEFRGFFRWHEEL